MITTTSFVPENKDDYLEMLVFVALWQKTKRGSVQKIQTKVSGGKKIPVFFKVSKTTWMLPQLSLKAGVAQCVLSRPSTKYLEWSAIKRIINFTNMKCCPI